MQGSFCKMTYSDALQKFGLPASSQHRDEIRKLLVEETIREQQGESGEEMLRVLCVQLFSLAVVEDSLLIWAAKNSSFDAGCGLDLQFLCGAGLEKTKEYLAASNADTASKALQRLHDCEQSGDFHGWAPQKTINEYRGYFGLK